MPHPTTSPTRSWFTALVGVVATSVTLVGCGSSDEVVRVGAAASLTDVMAELGRAFEDTDPGARVEFTFASSSDLAQQIVDGAPIDVFASADTGNMDEVGRAELLSDEPVIFATNRLVVVVEEGNPLGIDDLGDLTAAGLVVVGCSPDVPIGAYTADVLDRAGVDVSFTSLEENVRGIVTKVALGEADAGIVYATDVSPDDDRIDAVEIPVDSNVVVTYPVATIGDDASAAAFVRFVLSEPGREILRRFGFGTP